MEKIGDTIKLVQGDHGHSFDLTILDENGAPLDVSAATVRLYFRKDGATSLTATITASKPNGGTDGKVRFVWPEGALDEAGNYTGEVEIDSVTTVQTVYPVLKFKVRNQVQV